MQVPYKRAFCRADSGMPWGVFRRLSISLPGVLIKLFNEAQCELSAFAWCCFYSGAFKRERLVSQYE